jgi:bifunctional non-homologous end joining protein LigD
MQTPDGEWRVEIVRRGRTRWHRIVSGDNQIDWLTIAGVQRILAEARVDMASSWTRTAHLLSATRPARPDTTYVRRDRCRASVS